MAAGDVVREGFPIVFVQRGRHRGCRRRRRGDDRPRSHPRRPEARASRGTRLTLDENRPQAVARRRKTGYRMPRENIDRLVDPGSFDEYWPLIVARQHQRHSMEELRRNTPADGVVAGMCSINGTLFDETRVPRGAGALRLHRAGGHARAAAITTSRIGSSSWRIASGCRWSCSARAAEAGPATITSARASRSIPRRSRPTRS